MVKQFNIAPNATTYMLTLPQNMRDTSTFIITQHALFRPFPPTGILISIYTQTHLLHAALQEAITLPCQDLRMNNLSYSNTSSIYLSVAKNSCIFGYLLPG